MLRESNAFLIAATASDASQLFSDLLPWLLLLIVFVVIGGIALYLIRRTINPTADNPNEPFTLEGLRRMRSQGQITDEEFAKARTAMISRMKADAPTLSADNGTSTPTTPENGADDTPPDDQASGNASTSPNGD